MFGGGIYLESSLWSEVMFLVLVASFLVASASANLPGSSSDNICYFRNNDVSIQYELSADFNTVKFITSRTDFNISNKYTGLAFGDSMADLDIILVLNDDQGTRFATGHTVGYKSPVMDSTPYVTPQYKNTEKGIFTYIFTRPLESVGPHMKDLSLSLCTPMHIILEGPVREGGKIGEHTSKPIKTEICPKHCRVSESWSY